MQGQNHVQHVMSSRRIGHGSKPLQARSAGATETLVINPKAGLQARHVSYATGVSGNNVTYHSNSSGKPSGSRCWWGNAHCFFLSMPLFLNNIGQTSCGLCHDFQVKSSQACTKMGCCIVTELSMFCRQHPQRV